MKEKQGPQTIKKAPNFLGLIHFVLRLAGVFLSFFKIFFYKFSQLMLTSYLSEPTTDFISLHSEGDRQNKHWTEVS